MNIMMPLRRGFKLRFHDKESEICVFPTHETVCKDVKIVDESFWYFGV